MLGLRWPKVGYVGQLKSKKGMRYARDGGCHGHLSARGGPPGRPLSRNGNLILDKLDTEIQIRPTTALQGENHTLSTVL